MSIKSFDELLDTLRESLTDADTQMKKNWKGGSEFPLLII